MIVEFSSITAAIYFEDEMANASLKARVTRDGRVVTVTGVRPDIIREEAHAFGGRVLRNESHWPGGRPFPKWED